MWTLSLLPFGIQMLAILFDEGYFHWKRGLPRWERIGHPLDTLSSLLCMGFVIFVPFSAKMLIVYILLSSFSCLFITKDEFVHKHHCCASDNWLHAILFVLHPITLTSAAFIWPVAQGIEVAPWISHWLSNKEALKTFLYLQFSAMISFMIYQIVFWNWIGLSKYD